MNPIAMLRAALHADPFQPFDVVLTSGKRLHVHHPDYLVFTPSFIVWTSADQQDGSLVMPLHVSHVELSPKRAA